MGPTGMATLAYGTHVREPAGWAITAVIVKVATYFIAYIVHHTWRTLDGVWDTLGDTISLYLCLKLLFWCMFPTKCYGPNECTT